VRGPEWPTAGRAARPAVRACGRGALFSRPTAGAAAAPPPFAVAIVTGVATWQEFKSDASVRSFPDGRARASAARPLATAPRAFLQLAALSALAPPSARVRRDGRLVEVEASALVPGDILCKAPARARARARGCGAAAAAAYSFPPSRPARRLFFSRPQRCAPATACPPTRACSRRWTLRRTSPR
jgi:hypothetical protein